MFLVLVKSTSEDSMAWNESRKLTWNDFKANPKPKSNAAALTASGITFGYSVKTSGQRIIDFSVSVEAHFYPNKSWYLKDKGNAHILKHEQLHFDITELHVRKLKKRIAQTTFTLNIETEMNSLHTAVNDDLAQMQQIYDLESDHSQNIEKQKEWQRFINLELAKLAYYSK